MDTPRLRILMLGSPEITWDGARVRIARQQMRLLLFFLAAQSQPVPRSQLCQLFWPDQDDEKARKLLREALSKLRASLPDPSVLIAYTGEVYLDRDKVYVDAWEFKEATDPLLASAEIGRAGKLPDWMYSEMRRAIALCRGNIKMEGVDVSIPGGYENFLNMASQAYDYTRLRLLERLASHCIAIGDLDEAILWISRALEIDPLDEENNFLVLNCLRDCGRTRDALEYIGYLENVYISSGEQELPRSIRQLKTTMSTSQYDLASDVSDWPGLRQDSAPFIGRRDLIEKLNNALNRKGIVSVRGAAGIGKNRLLEEFYLNLLRKPRLLFCSGKPLVKCAPFEPIIEGLRTALRQEDWMLLPMEYRAVLYDLFPEARGIASSDLSVGHELEGDEFLLVCEALHQLLILMAKNRTLLFVIDIILWCDDATIDFLSYLCDRGFFSKYSLLVTCSRKEDFNAKVEVFTNRNTVKGLLEKIEILPLTMEETALFVQKMTGSDVSQQFVEKFYQDTGGNPYFMVEGLKSLLSLNFDFSTFIDGGLYPIPDTVRSLIHEKTLRLSENGSRVLQAGAILGQYFNPAVVEAMGEISTEDAMNAFEELERMSIISPREHPQFGMGYFFDHDQIREVVLREISPLRKRHFHLNAVNAMKRAYGNRPELESLYAYHFERAGEWVNAFNAWIRAAEFARTRFSLSDRYDAYDRAFNLIPLLPQDALEANVLNLVIAWGDLAYDLSDIETCEKLSELCLDFGEQTQDPLLLGVGWSGRGRTLGMKLRVTEGIEAIRRAQFFLERTDNLGEKLEAVGRLGILYTLAEDSRMAVQTYEGALGWLPSLKGDRETDAMINILSQLVFQYIETGWPHKGLEIGEQAVNLSALVKRRSARVQAATALASSYYYTGNYQKSLQNALSVYSLAEKINLRWWLSALDAVMGRDYLALGDMDASWRHFQRAYEREKTVPEGRMFQLACSLGGNIHRLYGDLANAAKLFKLGMESARPDFATLENAFFYALTVYQRGKLAEARKLLQTVVQQSSDHGIEMTSLLARQILCGAMEKQGAEASPVECVTAIADEMAARNFGAAGSYGRVLQAKALLERGSKEEAGKILRSVLSEDKDNQYVWVHIAAILSLVLISESGEERSRLQATLTHILAELRKRSTLPPLRRLYYNYRKEVLKSP